MKRITSFLTIALLAVGLVGSLGGCPSPEVIERQQRPAHLSVELINGKTVVDVYAGTVPLEALFKDMENLPEAETTSVTLQGHNSTYPYWWFHQYPYPYWIDQTFQGTIYRPLDESQVRWGLALRYGNDAIPMTIVGMEAFQRGQSLRLTLDDFVPDRVNDFVEMGIVATYPGMRPIYRPIGALGQQSGTFCWAQLKCNGKAVWTISIDGVLADEHTEGGVGTGLIRIDWPFTGSGNGDDDGRPGRMDIVTGTTSSYIDIEPWAHTDKSRLYFGRDKDTGEEAGMPSEPEQVGVFAWTPEFPSANGTTQIRWYSGDVERINLENVFQIAREAGATKVAIAGLGYDFGNPNPYPYLNRVWDEVWADRQFTAGWPWWIDTTQWEITLNGQRITEERGQGGEGLGYVIIPIPNSQASITKLVVGNGSISGPDQVTIGNQGTFTAIPSSGSRFVRWEGGLSGTANPQTITVNEAITITAVFEQNTTPQGSINCVLGWNGSQLTAYFTGASSTVIGFEIYQLAGSAPWVERETWNVINESASGVVTKFRSNLNRKFRFEVVTSATADGYVDPTKVTFVGGLTASRVTDSNGTAWQVSVN